MGNYFEEGIQKQQVRQKNIIIREIYERQTKKYKQHFWKKIKIISKQNMYNEIYKTQLDNLYSRYKSDQPVQLSMSSDGNLNQKQNQFFMIENQYVKMNNGFTKYNCSLLMQLDILYKSSFKQERAFNRSARLFIKWIRVIEVHLKRGFLLNVYTSFFQYLKMEINKLLDKKAEDKKERSQQEILQQMQLNFQYLKSLINKFARIMNEIYKILYRFTQFKQLQEGKLFNDQNLNNFIVNYIFLIQDGCLMNLLKKYINIIKQREILAFMIKLNIIRNQPILFFDIPQYFIIGLNIQEVFFTHASRKLEKLKECVTPISKVKVLIETVREIKQQIITYYIQKQHKQDMKSHSKVWNKQLESDPILNKLNPDCITNIVIYIIARVANRQLLIELEIVQNFLSQNSLNSASGYYLSLFKMSSEYILNSKFEIIY